MPNHQMPIIAYHRSPLSQKFGAPRQSGLVAIKSCIEFVMPYATPDAFLGIEQYSHLWVLWQFHHNKPQDNFRPQVRPPRLGGNDKMGVFATRSMYRPSALGLSVVALDGVEIVRGGVVLHIMGADMIDGTPILDVKPYLPYVDSVPQATSHDIQKPPTKHVKFTQEAQVQFAQLVVQDLLQDKDKDLMAALIAQDPRPAYRQHETDVLFVMQYGLVDVGFMMTQDQTLVISRLTLIKTD